MKLLSLRAICLAGAAVAGHAQTAHADRHPAATMREVQDQFAACIHPPTAADGTRLTFYFSLRTNGTEFGRLRTVWVGFKGSDDDRRQLLDGLVKEFASCLPLVLSADLARTIPGKVYFLEVDVAADGRASALLRPYGSDIPLPYNRYRR